MSPSIERAVPVERAIQILDFLTTHPGRGFTLSELSRRLRISKATAHAILTRLTDRALLLRNPDTLEYRLGPALVPMGAVAERTLPALTQAKREAEKLAAEHDGESMVVMTTDEEILTIGYAGVPTAPTIPFREGQRQPLAPPLGTIGLAWTDKQAVGDWLDRLGPEFNDAERERYRAALEAVRRRGYAIGMHVQALHELQELYSNADLHTPEGRQALSRALAAFARDEYFPVGDDLPPDARISGIAAPVFGADGAVIFAIAIIGDYSVQDIPSLSRGVLRAAGRVMAATGGRYPEAADVQPAAGATRARTKRASHRLRP